MIKFDYKIMSMADWRWFHMATDNVQYKDRLFNFLFGSEENKEWTLSLYNAVNRSHYTDPSMIKITTIREVMYSQDA